MLYEHKMLGRERTVSRNPITRGLCMRVEEEFCLEERTTRDRLRDGLAIEVVHRRMRAIKWRRGQHSESSKVHVTKEGGWRFALLMKGAMWRQGVSSRRLGNIQLSVFREKTSRNQNQAHQKQT